MTAARLIAIQSLANNYWGKLDLIIPVDWENDKAIPATAEVQLGKMFSSLARVLHGRNGRYWSRQAVRMGRWCRGTI